MGTMARRMWRAGNAAATWTYRRTGGRIGGRARGGSPVLLLTAPGRSSGQPHTVPVAYIERDGAYYLAATAGADSLDVIGRSSSMVSDWPSTLNSSVVLSARLCAAVTRAAWPSAGSASTRSCGRT